MKEELIKGTIVCEYRDKGSKSEGEVAMLHVADSEKYILYRQGRLPQNDEYLLSFNNQDVAVEGTLEDKFMCVTNITELSDEDNCPEEDKERNETKEDERTN